MKIKRLIFVKLKRGFFALSISTITINQKLQANLIAKSKKYEYRKRKNTQ